MNSFLTALILAAGVSAFVYAKLGRRVGYGNGGNVWILVAVSFAGTFLVAFILFKTVISLN